ncbi:MAG: prepilin-type N-terminal cleavage/methylation domain-containing protein [Mariniblastus sp.]|nr:prepilin-type N-terminal cleavage/methylation domain-containing protein [Mariniblastus sp.]
MFREKKNISTSQSPGQPTPWEGRTVCAQQGSRSQTGFSLVEVVLALALSVVIIAAIGYAVHMYMLTLTRQQADIERKQVARSIIMMIHNDLRGAIQYKPQDYSGLENLYESLVPDVLSSMMGEEDEEAADEEETEEVVEEDMSTSRPTMIGNSRAIVIDVSRLPRLDEYNPLIAMAPGQGQLASDVKAINYFFSDEASAQSDDIIDSIGEQGGLYRRRIDRAVAAYLGDTGLAESPDEYTKLIAPEVAGIAFRYWSGEGWEGEWDSDEAGGFPLAIEVTLELDPFRATDPSLANNEDEMDYYRTVIHLPVAEPPPEEAQSP